MTIIRKKAHINLIIYRPTTVNGQLVLAQRVADTYATTVIQYIKALRCPDTQKLELLDAVIQTARDASTPQLKTSTNKNKSENML